MGRLAGRRIGVGLLLIVLAVGALWLARLLVDHKGLDWLAKASEIASFLLAVAGLLVTPFGRIARWLRGPQPLTAEEIAGARDRMHATLSAAWDAAASQVYENLPIQVRFAPRAEDGAQLVSQDGRIPGASAGGQCLAGDFESVSDAFWQKPRYRRVVLGDAGAGKTVLVTELQRKLLEAPRPDDPLPVIVPAAAWRPDRQSLLDWLAAHLAASYAWLPAAHARALVASGKVLPVLDGLDEMPASLRPDAIGRINEHRVYRPLVVTSREEEYRDAVHVTGVGVKGAVVLSVEPLHASDVRAYLQSTASGPWSAVLGQMEANPSAGLAETLANPLMLWLAGVVYEDKDPNSLATFGSRTAIEDHLLHELVPTVYENRDGGRTRRQFGCSAVQAMRWLANLAWDNYIQQRITGGSPVLAWWRYGAVAGRWRLLGIGLRAAVLSVVAAALAIWVLAQQGNWRNGGYRGPVNFADLLLAGPVGQMIRPTFHQLSLGLPKSAGGQAQATVTELFLLINDIFSRPLLIMAALVVFAVGVAVRLGMSAVHDPVRLDIRLVPALMTALAGCLLLFGMAVLGAFLLLRRPQSMLSAGAFFDARSTWTALLAVSLVGLTRIMRSFTRQSDTSGNLSPRESLRLDRQADLVVTVSSHALFAVAVWLFCGHRIAVAYLVFAITATVLAVATGGQDPFASRQYTDGRMWLAIRGRLPWRTMAFLEDASRRGVLQQSGAAYQFRHVRLWEQVVPWRSASGPVRVSEWKERLRELTIRVRGHLAGRNDEWQVEIRLKAARYLRMAQTTPGAVPPDFAGTLDRLTGQLQHLRDGQAVAALRDLLDAYRALAATDPVTFRARLATVLMDSADTFPREEALRVIEEATGVYRELAEADPAAFLPGLARAVRRLADQLTGLGRAEDALRVTCDLIETCRRRAETDQSTVLPVLAQSLSDLGDRLWKARPEESLAAWEESSSIWSELDDMNPAEFASSLTSSLDLVASSYKALGRREEELAAIRNALGAYRERAVRTAEIRCQIAASHLAAVLQPHQEPDNGPSPSVQPTREDRIAALGAAATAATEFGQLADSCPAAFLPDLAEAARGLAIDLRASGWQREARILADQAARIRGASGGMRWQWRISETGPLDRINDLALRLWKLGELQEALIAAQQSRALRPAGHVSTDDRDRAWASRLALRLLRELEVTRSRKVARLWRQILRERRRAWWGRLRRNWGAQRLLDQARQRFASTLELQSDTLDTLAFRRLIAGRTADARSPMQKALSAQQSAVATYREMYGGRIYWFSASGVSEGLSSPDESAVLARSLDTLALRLRAETYVDAGETAVLEAEEKAAVQEAEEIRQLSRVTRPPRWPGLFEHDNGPGSQ